MAAVNILNVYKRYGPAEILKGISVDIEDGAFVTLVGPSGCGKSTLLRMIAGLEDISGGDIVIDGHVVNDIPPKARDIAMVFQNYALYPHMTVSQNMSFSLVLGKEGRSEIDRKVERAAEILGLRELLDRYPRQLSGGQRQRVAMGRAIVRNPKVFLFDEPLSNLDAKLRVQMRAEIKALHQQLGTTTIYVTHDQIEAMTMADKIVVMNAGRIEQVGAPLDLYDHPANMFVASFIGSPAMNFLEGTMTSEGVRLGDGTVLMTRQGKQFVEGRPVIYGVRPEHMRIAHGEEPGVEARVRVIEPTGSETHIVASIGTKEITVLLRERLLFRPGEMIRLAANNPSAHLFGGVDGTAIAAPFASN